MNKPQHILLFCFFIVIFSSCISDPVRFKEPLPVNPQRLPPAVEVEQVEVEQPELTSEIHTTQSLEDEGRDPFGIFRKRSPIPKNLNKYEGSLWKGENSFGNFFLSKRARNRGDLLKIIGIQKNITDFEDTGEEDPDITADVAFLEVGEVERLKVYKSIDTMVVKIVNIDKNGLLAVYGEKKEYKDSNNVRFFTTIKGYIRQNDILEDNTVNADLVQSFDFNTDRKVKLTAALKGKIIENLNKADNISKETEISPLLREELVQSKELETELPINTGLQNEDSTVDAVIPRTEQ